MQQLNDILTLAHRHPLMMHELDLLHEVEKQIPGSVSYSIRRYKMQPQWNMEDVGMLAYNYKPKMAFAVHNRSDAESLQILLTFSASIIRHLISASL